LIAIMAVLEIDVLARAGKRRWRASWERNLDTSPRPAHFRT
jgi:hypothetical protein